MSFAYDQYLAEHIGNVNKGLHWMLDNLGFKEERPELEIALVNFDHDESKYSVEEYDAYDKYFYGGNRSYKVIQDFNYAWLHHIHNNPHHWQYWVLLEDDPESGLPYKALEIPVHVIFEMIADWWSFSWKSGNLFEIFNWYADHRSKQIINPKSREIVEYILDRIWKVLIMQETVAGHDISEIEKQYKRFWAEQEDVRPAFGKLEYNPDDEDSYREAADNAAVTAYGNDVEFFGLRHSDSKPIGKVISTRETENGLEVTVEYSKDKQEFWKHLIEDRENDITHSDDYLEHHGILGQKWGVRRYQNKDGSLTEAGRERYGKPSTPVHYDNKKDPRFKQTVFVSGSSKTQNEDSQYYRKELPKDIRKELDRYVKDGDTILVGDAPGIDRQVQDYLNSKNYNNVEVYGPGKQVRYSANKKWKTNPIDDPDHEEGSTEWLAKKDEAMAERASDGIAIILDEGAKATRKNVGRLADMGKNVSVYQLDKNGADLDRWFDEYELLDIMDTEISKLYDDIKHSESKDDEDLYGVPELKKFPMPDKKHVRSAIRFFNYVDPKYEKELAEAILEKAKEFGLDFEKDISVGEENRFRKYLSDDHLEHSGRLGQKWGVQNGPPYPLDRETVKKEYGSDAKVMESNKTDDSNGSDKSSESEKKHRTTKVSSVKKELTTQIRELKNEYKKAAADENADPEYLELLDMEINELKEAADARQRMAKQNHPDEYYTPVSKRLLELEPVEKLEDLKKLDPNADIEKARMNINHPDGDNMIGRDYNCPNCAAAFELTERGYDVIARRKKPGSNVENVEDFFKGGKLQNVGGETEIPPYPEMIEKFSPLPTAKKHQQELNSATRKQFWNSVDVAMKEAEANVKQYGEQQGIGARGLFVVGWIEDPKMAKRTTAFHAMNYKVVAGRNGEPEIKIFDTQSRKAYKQNGDVNLQDVLYDADPRDIYMMRTDTLELSDKITQAVYSNRRG